MEKRYRALRAIAAVFKVLGWVILILGILGACVTSGGIVMSGGLLGPLGAGQRGGGELGLVWGLLAAIVTFIVMLLTVGLYALILIAASEGIYVFLDIEENTREMARRLGQLGESAGPSPPTY